VEPLLGNRERASTGYARFAKDVKAGDRILLADGAVEMRAVKTDGVSVRCEVICGGQLGGIERINLPPCHASPPPPPPTDLAPEVGLALLDLSRVRTAEDGGQVRQRLEERKARLPVIAKIEKPQAWENIDSILDVSDGVMVARGDLGVEMALERVPFIQKGII